MTKQILLTLLNCSWQWGLLGGLTWLITRRFRRANSTTHLLWFLFLLSLPILFVLNQFVPALSISRAVPELAKAQPVEIVGLTRQTADLSEDLLTERTADLPIPSPKLLHKLGKCPKVIECINNNFERTIAHVRNYSTFFSS